MKQAEHCGRIRRAFELGDAALLLVVDPAVAAGLLDADVEPDRRIEAGLLGEHQVGQFHAEILAILGGLEVAVLLAPVGDGVDHALHQLRHRGLAVGRPQLAVEILAGDDVGGGLRPVHRHFDVALLKNHRTFVVADRGGTRLPLDLVVRGLAGFQFGGKVSRE